MPTSHPRVEKMSKKINKNDKNFTLKNPLTCKYLRQPTFREKLKF
jgi:hypothetical protein